jgi:hypothetical protein
VTLGATVRMDAKLNVASSTATVEIFAEVAAIQTENAGVLAHVQHSTDRDVPNPANDLTCNVQLSPGTVMNSNGGYGTSRSAGYPERRNFSR